ncbi:unnamed protein product [Camellia sinensis]
MPPFKILYSNAFQVKKYLSIQSDKRISKNIPVSSFPIIHPSQLIPTVPSCLLLRNFLTIRKQALGVCDD